MDSSLTRLTMTLGEAKERCFKKGACGGKRAGYDVFTDEGDSILSVFFSKPLRTKQQDN